MEENSEKNNESILEKSKIEDIRIGFEEANRWSRHIDNFYWAISSFWIGGNIIGFHAAFSDEVTGKEKLLSSFFMLIFGILFYLFTENTDVKKRYLQEKIDTLEDKMYIDVVPEFEQFSKDGMQFIDITRVLFYLFFCIWGIIFVSRLCGQIQNFIN